jgi:hypothetical protein
MTAPISRRTLLGASAAVLAASACTDDSPEPEATPTPRPPRHRRARASVRLLSGDASELSVETSRAVFAASPAAVLASADAVAGDAGVDGPVRCAEGLGVPLLVVGASGVTAELDRLGAGSVVTYGDPTDGWESVVGGRRMVDGTTGPGAADDARSRVPLLAVPTGDAPLVAVTGRRLSDADRVALVTIRAAGGTVVHADDGDPRTSDAALSALREDGDRTVVGIGHGLGPAERFAQRVRTAANAPELPGGGLVLFPYRRMVALYGHPGTSALGVLGEQKAKASVRRVEGLVSEYQPLSDPPVVPAWEIIATVAAGSAGHDRDYSTETALDVLEPWVDAAEKAGVYVVLDLQPGRASFISQARRYERLLTRPHVGLALDPEWRLRPGEQPLTRIGSVEVNEVNDVIGWLADLVRRHTLPQKLLTLHQFQVQMLRDRQDLDTGHDELAILVHADGQGSPSTKHDTWRAVKRNLPEGVWLGWKNFYDEDSPMLTPRETMSEVTPTPWFISYQ